MGAEARGEKIMVRLGAVDCGWVPLGLERFGRAGKMPRILQEEAEVAEKNPDQNSPVRMMR